MKRVTAHPNGRLYAEELELLERMANGETDNAICRCMDLNRAELASLQRDACAKLQATTHAHLIARAFQAGVLRALCLVVLLSAAPSLDQPLRHRNPTRAPVVRMMARAIGGRI